MFVILVTLLCVVTEGSGLTCYQCDRPHHQFPGCLTHPIVCHASQGCHIGNSHGEIKAECVSKHECDAMAHGHQCSMKHDKNCELCCHHDGCVASRLVEVHPHFQLGTHTTKGHNQVHPTTSSTTWDLILSGSCADDLVSGCGAVKSAFCSSEYGIATCPETCGLCTRLKALFNGGTTCKDQLLNDHCLIAATPQFCQSVAATTCPKSCNMCNSLVVNLVNEIITASKYGVATLETGGVNVVTVKTIDITNSSLPSVSQP